MEVRVVTPLVFYPLASTYLSVCQGSRTLFNRSSFAVDFVFGSGSSAYQYEGAAHTEGRKPSIWDTFIIDFPGGHSIDEGSWFRLLQILHIMVQSFTSGGVNQKGVDFYNYLINELISNGLEPFVTSLHRDLPQALEDKYGGFLSPKIVKDYRDCVDFCFKEFGDRVKYWANLNEPNLFTKSGLRRYYVWSFLDNFEWDSGYTIQFGITYVDYKNGLKRYLKDSALWFKNFPQRMMLIPPPLP